MRDKLQLKEVLPYLDSDVMAIDVKSKDIRKVTLNHQTYDLKTVGWCHLFSDYHFITKEHKLVLRPLSDLTDFINNIKTDYEVGEEFLAHARDFIGKENEISWDCCPRDILEQIYENHFDIDNLIERGLAVDINTIKK